MHRKIMNLFAFNLCTGWHGVSFKLIPFVVLLITCGCQNIGKGRAQNVHPSVLLKLERGISQSKLETSVGVASRHEFTTARSNTATRCVSYYFAADYLKYFFVFTNDGLEKIILPPRFEHEISPWERGKRAVWKSYDPEERLAVVVQAPDLRREEIVASMEHRHKPNKFDNALPGAIIAGVVGAPITLVQSPSREAERREILALAQHFDPYRLQLTMPLADVEQIFGAPRLIDKLDDDSEIRYYGSPELGVKDRLLWVSVLFKNGKVTAVFSDDFFDYHKIQAQPRTS